VDDVSEQYDAAAAAVVAESDGSGGTGVPGHGVQYFDKVAERDRLQRERDALQQQLDATRREVRQQLDATYAKTSADDRTQLATLQGRVDQAQHSLDSELAAHQQDVAQSDGILNRLTALGRIQHRSPMLATAHWLLFLFMTALECLPIIFKTMLALAPPSLYERLVALEEEKAEQRVRLRMQTEYEEAETLARSALAAAEARAARTLEAESRATGMVLEAQLDVTRDGVRRWRDEQLGSAPDADVAAGAVDDDRVSSFLDDLESDLTAASDGGGRFAG
jgi:hypothetical protein